MFPMSRSTASQFRKGKVKYEHKNTYIQLQIRQAYTSDLSGLSGGSFVLRIFTCAGISAHNDS